MYTDFISYQSLREVFKKNLKNFSELPRLLLGQGDRNPREIFASEKIDWENQSCLWSDDLVAPVVHNFGRSLHSGSTDTAFCLRFYLLHRINREYNILPDSCGGP